MKLAVQLGYVIAVMVLLIISIELEELRKDIRRIEANQSRLDFMVDDLHGFDYNHSLVRWHKTWCKNPECKVCD